MKEKVTTQVPLDYFELLQTHTQSTLQHGTEEGKQLIWHLVWFPLCGILYGATVRAAFGKQCGSELAVWHSNNSNSNNNDNNNNNNNNSPLSNMA